MFFSKRLQFSDVTWTDEAQVVDALFDRIDSYFIVPARALAGAGDGFACGLISVCTIDFVAKYCFPNEKEVGVRFCHWVDDNLPEFRRGGFGRRLYDDFRNGLVHEGRIKEGSSFVLEGPNLVMEKQGFTVVHAARLLSAIEGAIQAWYKDVTNNTAHRSELVELVRLDFAKEIAVWG